MRRAVFLKTVRSPTLHMFTTQPPYNIPYNIYQDVAARPQLSTFGPGIEHSLEYHAALVP